VIGISCCAGGVTGGVTGGAVGSPLQEGRTARQAIQIVVIAIDLLETLRARLTEPRKQRETRSRMDDPCGGWA
jgi:hypothetical protein